MIVYSHVKSIRQVTLAKENLIKSCNFLLNCTKTSLLKGYSSFRQIALSNAHSTYMFDVDFGKSTRILGESTRALVPRVIIMIFT